MAFVHIKDLWFYDSYGRQLTVCWPFIRTFHDWLRMLDTDL